MKSEETVLLFDDQLRSIASRLDALNKVWHDQPAGVYLEFPEEFAVRSDDDDSCLGFFVESGDGFWAFRPAIVEEQEDNKL
jgi:hypothetical protein